MAETGHIPKHAVAVVGVLLLATVVGAGIARHTGIGAVRLESRPATSARLLTFEDRDDGAIVVRDAATGAVSTVLHPGQGDGFIRGVMRGFARERRTRGIGQAPPFEVALREGHQITVTDPQTGRTVDLASFGRPNAQAFARLVERPGGNI